MKALVAFDGSLNSKTALRYAVQKVKDEGGELLVVHVFNRNLFIDYDAGPGAEQMARIEAARHVEEARRVLEGARDTESRIILEEGEPAEEVLRVAHHEGVDIIFSPPSFRSIVKSAPCPVSVIPGYLLLPLDSTDVSAETLSRVSAEAKASGSKVILLGIVPIHIYNKWEKRAIEKVKKETSGLMKRIKKELNDRQVETKEIIRSGYPDEEILKVADEFPVSMILMPSGGDEPSELSKAAAILVDREPGTEGKPLVLIHSA